MAEYEVSPHTQQQLYNTYLFTYTLHGAESFLRS